MPILQFLNTHQKFDIPKGTELLEAYKTHPEMPLKFGCTQGTCEVCMIQIIKEKENLSPPTQQEKATLKDRYQQGYRLACQCALLGDIQVALLNTDRRTP